MPSKLLDLKKNLDHLEAARLSPHAARGFDAPRRRGEAREGYRQAFSQDTDRILHSRAYTRYIDKTQVFYLIRNDHITHRVLHVQLVSKIARTSGRFLGLNEDLIEAIALGHDIGHPPFGHDGETILADLCKQHSLPGFLHNVQSVRFLDRIERGGRGWNLTLPTLDGILCHDGEVHDRVLAPMREKTFTDHDRELAQKLQDPKRALLPMSLEGCLMRFCDTISYVGRDIEDAIELGLIERNEIPRECAAVLGETNGTIVYRLVTDLIENSLGQDAVAFSPEISAALKRLKKFNYERIYFHPVIKQHLPWIKEAYQHLFEACLNHLDKEMTDKGIHRDFLNILGREYRDQTPSAAIVRDFISSMTDDYFLAEAAGIGLKLKSFGITGATVRACQEIT